jgi:hypothetical protein
MSYSWRSAEDYRSSKYPTVRFRVVKMSMGRRLELTRRVKDLTKRLEFLTAGGSTQDKLDAAILAGEMDRLYWEFGLESLEGIDINGEPMSADSQFERGPEDLSREILQRIKQNLQLTEGEQKN